LAATGATLENLTSFAATTFATEIAPALPPDTQLAVGPAHVGEAVNSELSVWTRAGTLITRVDLDAFFAVPNGFVFSDPRLNFDRLSGRWFLSGFALDAAFDSNAYVAVSDTADPTQGWFVQQLTSFRAKISDQPKLGVSSDKVVMSWNDFSTTSFLGQETWVLQKSDLLTAAPLLHVAVMGPDGTRFAPVPVVALTAGNTAFVVYNNTCSAKDGIGTGACTTGSSSLGIFAITGTPVAANVAVTESDPALTETSAPPPAAQPSGAGTIDTNDDRLLSAVLQNNTLWTTASDACVVGGVVHACLRVVKVTTIATPTVAVDGDLGSSGEDLYEPAVTPDAANDTYVVATVSSSTRFPSVVAFGASATSGGFVEDELRAGTGNYAPTCSACAKPFRWGDYSGAVTDPSNPADIWVAGELATASPNNWATAIGEYTFAGPTIASITPGRGPTQGGTVVTVHGADFTKASTVKFGSILPTHVVVQSPTQLQATTPAHAPTSVHVTVTTADGTASSSGTFAWTSLVGYWMMDARGTISPFGDARNFGSLSGAVALVPRLDGTGYWMTNAAGAVRAFGAATLRGGSPALRPLEAVTTIAATPSANGYWLFTNFGRAFAFGDAHFFGDLSHIRLSAPIIASAATASGKGYYMVGRDGGIFAFGDAQFHGSTGNLRLNKPIVGIAPTPANTGYWLVASDGGVFAFNAPFLGSLGGVHLNRPVSGLVAFGNGYLMVATDGGVFDFSNQPFLGSLANHPPPVPVVAIIAFTK
jgi:IPT/TIG domain